MPGDSVAHQQQLDHLQRALDTMRAEPLCTSTFVRLAQTQCQLVAVLPPRFDQM